MTLDVLGHKIRRHDQDLAVIFDLLARLEHENRRLKKRVARAEESQSASSSQLATVIDLVSRDRG